MPFSEQEEFEFRLRMEQEGASAPLAPDEGNSIIDTAATGLKGVALATDYIPGNVRATVLGGLASAIGGEKPYTEQLKSGATNIASGEFAPSSGEYFRQMGIPKSVPDMEAPINYFSPRETFPRKMVARTKESPNDPLSTGVDIGIDALSGVGAAKAFNAVRNATTPAAKIISEYLSKKAGGLADLATIRHLRPTPKTAQRLGPEGLKGVAQEVRATGAVKPFQKVDQTAANLETLLDEVGAVKGGIVEASDKVINPHDVIKEIDDLIAQHSQTAQGMETIVPMLERKRAAFLRQYGTGDGIAAPSMSAKQLEAEKMAVQDAINYKADSKPVTRAQRDYAGTLQRSAEGLIDHPEFVRSKQSFGNIAEASDMANRTAGLTDGGGLMGHITDNAIGAGLADELINLNPAAALTMGARGLTKGRVASTVSHGAGKLERYLKVADLTKPLASLESTAQKVLPLQSGFKTPEQIRLVAQRKKDEGVATRTPQSVLMKIQGTRFAPIIQKAMERGNDAFGSTYFILMTNEPDFRKAMEEESQ